MNNEHGALWISRNAVGRCAIPSAQLVFSCRSRQISFISPGALSSFPLQSSIAHLPGFRQFGTCPHVGDIAPNRCPQSRAIELLQGSLSSSLSFPRPIDSEPLPGQKGRIVQKCRGRCRRRGGVRTRARHLWERKRRRGSDGCTAFRDDSRHSAYRRLQRLPNRLKRQRQLLHDERRIKSQHPKTEPLQHPSAPSISGNTLTMPLNLAPRRHMAGLVRRPRSPADFPGTRRACGSNQSDYILRYTNVRNVLH